MIYLFSGDDIKKRIDTYEKFIAPLAREAEIFFINKNNFDPMQIESLAGGASLFSKKVVTAFSNVFEKQEIEDFLIKKLPLFWKSENIFIFSEGKLEKGIVDEFKHVRAEINVFDLPKEKKEKFNNFLLAYALEDRDKLKLWIYFRQAMNEGIELEPLVGILFWKVKDMLLRKNFRNFTEEELKDFSAKLAVLLPEARNKGLDDESVFEKFLLEMF